MHDTIIFDFDGTLIDSAPGILATFAEVLSDANIQPAVSLDQNLIGPPLQPTMAKLIGEQRAAQESELLEQLVENFKRCYVTTGIDHTPAYPDAAQTLQALREHGKTLYLATNKRASPTLMLIEKFGWQEHFRRVYCIDSHQPAFADKTAMLKQLLRENSLLPKQSLYVGDTCGDWRAASACGIRFIAALWGYENWSSLPDKQVMLRYACSSLRGLGSAMDHT